MSVSQRRFGSLMVLLTLALFLGVSEGRAQSYYGTLKGSVVDEQGAVIANATVSITDVATHIKRNVVTNGSGEYVFGALDPGTFLLDVTAPNFKSWQQKGLIVATQQTLTIDTKLVVGTASQVVEVNASEPLIDSSTASNGQVFDAQKLQDLPNLGRNPFLLAKLNNNITATGDPRFNRFQDQSGSSAISVSGGPINGNNYEVDGVPITDFSNRAVIIPSVDSVQEMKIQANSYDAEMGRTGGGVFNTLLRSGSNSFHGNLYGSTRQSNWAANTWNNNHQATPVGRGNSTQYSYEGSIGGPVVIPKLYNGRDKTFFWMTEEGYRQRSPLAANYYLPSDLERQGIFTAAGDPIIYDPGTTNPVTGVRHPFAGNVIPQNRLSAQGLAILSALPKCVAPACSSGVAYGKTNFSPTDLLGDRADEFIGKIDHKMFSWWLANVSYMHYGSKEPGGDPLGSFAGTSGSYLLYRKVDAVTQNNTLTLSPTMVATVAFGFNRFPNNTLDLTSGYDQAAQLQFPAAYAGALQKKAFPQVTLTQSGPSGTQLGTNNSGPAVFYSRNLVTGISKSLGRHTLKAGYVFRSISVDFTNVSASNGTFNFSNTFTSINPSARGATGADLADLLLGYPTSASVQVVTPIALNVHYNAFYAQDDYRITQRLTANVGLRYEYEPGIRERNNKYAVGFDTKVVNPISSQGSGIQTLGGIEYAGQSGYPTKCCNNSSLKFAPRIGLVYALDQKTVVRGGYGVFYAPIYYSTSASLAPGYAATTNYVASNDGNKTPAGSLANPFPAFAQPTGNTLGLSQGLGSTLTTIDQNRRSPIVQQFSFDVQRELPYGVALELGYVGSRGRNILPGNGTTYNIDQVNLASIPYGVGACPANTGNLSPGAFLTTTSANPYAGHGGVGVIAAAKVSNSQLCQPFPEFASISVQPSSSKSIYNSMIVKGQKRLAHGLTMVSAFTWSSNWDSSFGQTSALNVGANGPQNVYNINGPGGEFARAINNIPLRFTFGGTYELPFGRGRQYLAGNRLLDLAVGGWNTNLTLVTQQGGPVPIQQNTNNNASFGAPVQRPNLVSGQNVCTSGPVQSRLTSYFNPAAFTQAPIGTYGNAPRTIGSCQAPGYRNLDASVFKEFHLTEQLRAEFRAEALNALNTPQFALNSSGLKFGNAAFGSVSTNTINFPRYISLGGKIIF